MAGGGGVVDDDPVRAPTFVTVVLALGSALALGGIALGVANAVPNTPPPAYVDHYVEDLRSLPPPRESAEILREATGDTVPSAPVTQAPPPTADDRTDDTVDDREDHSGPSDDHDDREDSDDRSDRSGGDDQDREDGRDRDDRDDDRSGSNRGRDHPEDS